MMPLYVFPIFISLPAMQTPATITAVDASLYSDRLIQSDAVRYSFTITCVHNRPVRTVVIGDRELLPLLL